MENSRLLARNNHTYENGRRYHGFKGEFPFPDDKKGQAHHGLLDYLWRKILDWQLFTVPITPLKKNHKVLDFATRSGAWVTELRNLENFQSKITAMDPSFMQRHDARYFVHHDLEGEWPFSSKQAFHYIHAQSLGGLIADWEGFHRNAYKHLVPGGWLEVKENDIRLYSEKDTTLDNRAPNVKQWEELMEQAAERFGKKINVAGMQRELMEGAGFVEVKEQVFKVPLGSWSEDPKWKSIGKDYLHTLLEGLEDYSLRLFTQTLGWTKEKTDLFLEEVRTELKQEDLHLYSYFRIVTGQKPQRSER